MKQKFIEYGRPFSAHGYKHVRFVEQPEAGLRFVDFADKIVNLRRTGWYTEDGGTNGEKFRGVVYRLPAGRGFVPGYVHVGCSDEDGAILAFDDIAYSSVEAARAADRFAEISAEHERDYHRAWQAGARYVSLGELIAAARDEAREIGAELRAAAKLVSDKPLPRLCATLRERVFVLRRQITEMRKGRKELLADYGREPGFADAAFDGALSKSVG